MFESQPSFQGEPAAQNVSAPNVSPAVTGFSEDAAAGSQNSFCHGDSTGMERANSSLAGDVAEGFPAGRPLAQPDSSPQLFASLPAASIVPGSDWGSQFGGFHPKVRERSSGKYAFANISLALSVFAFSVLAFEWAWDYTHVLRLLAALFAGALLACWRRDFAGKELLFAALLLPLFAYPLHMVLAVL
ncbi:MAG: hypothetical protein Q4A71_06630 [Actinomycetaceae bacterium]|nr:hypothetical protein [Actinomycetaceae bacterium]